MIDFIKINYSNNGYILPTEKIDFISDFNNNTGELNQNVTGKYFDFNIKRYVSGRTIITGSIHKYFNRADFNGNDLTALNFQKSVLDLRNEINLIPGLCILENVEIGINIQTHFYPNLLLENLLFHRSENFNKPISGAFYMQSAKDNYIIKMYDKTHQNKGVLRRLESELKGNKITTTEHTTKENLAQIIKDQLKPNTLRFEIKFLKMSVLNKIGISTLADLCNPKFYDHLKNLLLKEFQEVYFFDFTTEILKMRNPEQNKFKDYQNPNYWNKLNIKDKSYHKKRFTKLTLKYSQNIKGKISEMICKKMDELTAKSLDILPDILAPHQLPKFRQITHSYIGVKSLNSSTDLKGKNEGANIRLCKVTNLDISMQKKNSIYVCTGALKYYKENAPEIYKGLEKKYLTEQWKHSNIKLQFYHIAKNIRNQKTNPNHNPRNSRLRFEQRNYHPNQLQINF